MLSSPVARVFHKLWNSPKVPLSGGDLGEFEVSDLGTFGGETFSGGFFGGFERFWHGLFLG